MGNNPWSQAPEKGLPHQQLRLPKPYPQRRARSGPALTQKTMLKPNRKYFPQQPTSGSWNWWCLPGMVSGHLPPREPEPETGPALCGLPRPGAAPGLARWLRLHGQSHTAHRLPRPLWHRPRRSDRHTRSAVSSSDPALQHCSGPTHSISPHPAPSGLDLLGTPPMPRPSKVQSSRSPSHNHDSAPSRALSSQAPPMPSPYPPAVPPTPRPRLCPSQPLFSSPASKPGPASDPPQTPPPTGLSPSPESHAQEIFFSSPQASFLPKTLLSSQALATLRPNSTPCNPHL